MGNRLEILKMPFLGREAAPAAASGGDVAAGKTGGLRRAGGRRLPLLVTLLAVLMLLDAGVVVYDARERSEERRVGKV